MGLGSRGERTKTKGITAGKEKKEVKAKGLAGVGDAQIELPGKETTHGQKDSDLRGSFLNKNNLFAE